MQNEDIFLLRRLKSRDTILNTNELLRTLANKAFSMVVFLI